MNVLLTLVRIQAGLSIHSYGAYNVAICSAAVLLVHYVSERMMGSLRGVAMSAAEVATFITFIWMMVQKGQYVGKSSRIVACAALHVGGFTVVMLLMETRTEFTRCWRRDWSHAPYEGRALRSGSGLCRRDVKHDSFGQSKTEETEGHCSCACYYYYVFLDHEQT